MMRPLRIRETLIRNCSSCHTDRRFSSLYGRPRDEILAVVNEMRALPGAEGIRLEDVPRIEAALITIRCTVCHDEALTGQVALMPREARNTYLFGKMLRIRPVFRIDEAQDVIHAFDILLGESIHEVGLTTP